MAQAFPQSQFYGFDFHRPSIDRARQQVADFRRSDRVSFDVATAQDLPGRSYDLITLVDCLHDLGDPGGALRRIERALANDGTCMIVEPNDSADALSNINPVGRAFTATSVVLCLPTTIDQDGRYALGNHAGQIALRAIASDAGLRGVAVPPDSRSLDCGARSLVGRDRSRNRPLSGVAAT
jgi:SAM-dependent methyltransferase